MKKTFILTLFMMFCSLTFGQNWVPNVDDGTMSVKAVITIDGNNVNGRSLKLGAFDESGDCIGAVDVVKSVAYLTIYGKLPESSESAADLDVSFKLYDKVLERELEYYIPTMTLVLDNETIPTCEMRLLSVAKIGDVKYESLRLAVAAAHDGDEIVVIENNEFSSSIIISEDVTLNLNGKTVKYASTESKPAFRVLGDVVVKGGTIETTHASGSNYCFIVGQDANAGKLTIVDGKYDASNGGTSAVSVTRGELYIKGGEFISQLWTETNDYRYLINCMDTPYQAGNAKVFVSGGTFHNFNPENNLAEGANTDFCEAGYFGKNNGNDVYTVEGPFEAVNADTQVGYQTLAAAVSAAEEGHTVRILKDVTVSAKLDVAKSLVLEGKGHTLTYTGSDRAIDVANNANKNIDLTISNLNVNFEKTYCQRGINYNENGALTLNNVKVNGGSAVTYALNLPGLSDNANVTINNSSLTGNIALNVWGNNTTINAVASEFISIDGSADEGYAAIAFNNDGTTNSAGSVVRIDGGKIIAKDENEEPSTAVSNASNIDFEHSVNNETEIVGEIRVPVALVKYAGSDQFYSCYTLQNAINKAVNDPAATVLLMANVESSEIITIKGSVVINLNDKTVEGKSNRLFRITEAAEVTIENGKIENNVSGGRCIETRTGNVTLNLNEVELIAEEGASQPLTVGGSGENIAVNVTSSTISAGTGYGITTFNPVVMTLDGTEVTGYGALNIKVASSSLGSAGSVFNIENGSVLVGINNAPAGETNSFCVVMVEDKDITINVEGSTLEAVATNNPQSIFGIGNEIAETAVTGLKVNVDKESTLTLKGDKEAVILGLNDDQVLGDNLIIVPANYATELHAEGFATSAPQDDLVTVLGEAVASVNGTLYATLQAAVDAADGVDDVVVLVADATSASVVINKNLTIDLNGKTITAAENVYPVIRIQNNANVTVTGNGSITNADDYVFVLGDADIEKSGYLTIENGTFLGGTSVASVTKGNLTINGGEFSVNPYQGTVYTYLINCYDASYKNGTATVAITGGTFHNWNPENNAAEGEGTNFCPKGYKAFEGENETYTVSVILPEVDVTNIKETLTDEDPDLTFALNFAIKDIDKLTESYLEDLFEKYGNHYVDYVLTIEGMEKVDGSVTFNANGDANGYLAGQYDEWGDNWVTVPFENVVVENGESFYIMEYAAKLMNKPGLRFTLEEIATIVQNFDCGVYFTNEFLVANPNLKVTLVLKVFTEDASGNKIDNIDVAENVFNVSGIEAIVSATDKQTQYCAKLATAIETASAGATVTLLRDVESSEIIAINKGLTIDLSRKTVTSTAKKAFEVYANTTIKNGTINGANRCVDTRKAVELTLSDVTLNANEYTSAYGNPQPLTIGGSENGTKVNMTNVNISAEDGYGIISFVKTELTAENSTIGGYSALYVKPGSEESTFNFVKSTLSGSTAENDVEGNSFSTIALRASDVTVNVDEYSKVTSSGDYCHVISLGGKYQGEETTEGNNVTIAGTIDGKILSSKCINDNTVRINNDYASTLHSEGYATSAPQNGLVTVLGKAVASVNGTYYATLQAAVDAADGEDDVVVLVASATGAGVVINKNVTIDFNGNTYSFNEGVGSTGTPSNGFQILSGDVTLKNGTLNVAEAAADKFYILVQNYADLNVVDMTLDGTNLDKWSATDGDSYVLSNNSGEVNISGVTNITANNDGDKAFAFDVCKYANYDAPVVTVRTTGTITGKIEVTPSIANNLTITGGTYTVNVDAYCADGYACNAAEGKYTVVESPVAKIGETKYLTLAQAVAAAENGQKVELLRRVENGAGVVIDKNITIDFATFTYKFKSGVGSTGTESNGFQILKENTVTLQNGALEVNEIFSHNFYILVQNYANLTVNNMELDGTYLDKWSKVETDQDSYVLSNNSGTVNIIGATNITANNDGNKAFAFDVCDKQPYANPVVTVNTTGKISGNIEVSQGLTDNLHIQGGTYTLDVQTWCDEGYFSFANSDNTWTVKGPYVAKVGETYYATLQAAVDAADANNNVVLVASATGAGVVINKNVTIDFNGKTYSFNEGVGSTGTPSNGFQILSGGVTLKNGTLNVAEAAADKFYILVQNYANLNVVDMTLDGTNLDKWSATDGDSYVLSNNSGEVNISGETNIIANNDGNKAFAFDVCKYYNYAAPVVTVNTTGTITGKIEVSAELVVLDGIDENHTLDINGLEGTIQTVEDLELNVTTSVENSIVKFANNIYYVVEFQLATINSGWNWFSHYIENDDVLGQLQNQLIYNGGNQIKSHMDGFTFVNGGAWEGNLEATSPAKMYMINNKAQATVQIEGDAVDYKTTEITIHKGWNWIGYPVSESVDINEALVNLLNKAQAHDRIKGRGVFAEYIVDAPQTNFTGWDGSLSSFVPGQGYMYYSNSETPITFTYTVPASKAEARANVTADNNHWVPNSADYANNMTVTAVLNIDGNMMKEGFEVAAFANGEVRGSARPVFVEAIGQYVMFMTIYGEGGEELTFKCYDIYSDEEYTLGDRMVYADDAMIGSIGNPYMLTLNTMGIGENGYSTISLYPNPTTTNATISFEATCDMVEVFNSLGVRVAEYRNVDSIDGMEAAGVYVIRVTNGETVQNCRLIVK